MNNERSKKKEYGIYRTNSGQGRGIAETINAEQRNEERPNLHCNKRGKFQQTNKVVT
jgi:hypothetical protein